MQFCLTFLLSSLTYKYQKHKNWKYEMYKSSDKGVRFSIQGVDGFQFNRN